MSISLTVYGLLLAAVVLETLASSFLEKSDGLNHLLPAAVSLLCYGASFYFGALVLRTMPIGILYAIWCGAGVVVAAILGYFINKQTLDAPAFMGMGLIVLGVAVIYFFSKSVSA